MNGEKQGVRESIDRLTEASIKAGTDPKVAREKAREAAIRWDRKQREQGR